MTYHRKLIYIIYKLVLLISTFSACTPHSVKKLDGPVLELGTLPKVTRAPNTCERLKSLFGLTYDQMLEKKTKLKEHLNIDFITRERILKFGFNETKSIGSIMNKSDNIIILIHGFWESSKGAMIQALAPEYLKKEDIKLFAVDARNIISFEYFRATTYARFLGEELGMFLSDIIKGGENASKLSIIGHSLGAHVAGVAGKTVHQNTGQRIARITGLDPAGPCFSNTYLDGKLDSTDASFVDVVHTNGGALGLKEPVGHIDYYPNSGELQPGCILHPTCDHSRAWEMFAETINYSNQFPGRKCDNWTGFKHGRCVKNEVAFMGAWPRVSTSGSYYLTTASSSPFGLGAAGSG